MLKFRSITTTAAAITLAAAAPAVAQTTSTGNADGTPSANICAATYACTYVNYREGKPTDVVKRTGTVRSWTVNAGSSGGTVRLRVLRRAAGGKFRFVRSSGLRTIAETGKSTFPTHLKVRKGDVLALTNDSSGIYMRAASPKSSVRYFDYTAPQSDGTVAKPNGTAPQAHVLLAGVVKS